VKKCCNLCCKRATCETPLRDQVFRWKKSMHWGKGLKSRPVVIEIRNHWTQFNHVRAGECWVKRKEHLGGGDGELFLMYKRGSRTQHSISRLEICGHLKRRKKWRRCDHGEEVHNLTKNSPSVNVTKAKRQQKGKEGTPQCNLMDVCGTVKRP